MSPTCLFHPVVAEWFDRSFAAATAAQAEAWPVIQAGEHTLIAAPTRVRQDAGRVSRGD
jgi:ATP-dependent Lhr-like helicase